MGMSELADADSPEQSEGLDGWALGGGELWGTLSSGGDGPLGLFWHSLHASVAMERYQHDGNMAQCNRFADSRCVLGSVRGEQCRAAGSSAGRQFGGGPDRYFDIGRVCLHSGWLCRGC